MSDQERSELERLLREWGAEEARLERRKAFVEGVLERNRAARDAERGDSPAQAPPTHPPAPGDSPTVGPADATPRPRLRVVGGRDPEADIARRPLPIHDRRRWLGIALPLAAAAGLGLFFLLRGGPPIESAVPTAGHTGIDLDPAAPLTREVLVALLERDLARFVPAVAPERLAQVAASDLPPGDPARGWIARGVVTTEGGHFEPSRSVTRGELVMSLYYTIGMALGRSPSLAQSEPRQSFADVPPDHFARAAVDALAPSIVAPRTDEVFGLEDTVSNQQGTEAVRATARKIAADRARSGEGP